MYEIEIMFTDNEERFFAYAYSVKDMERRYNNFNGRKYIVLFKDYID